MAAGDDVVSRVRAQALLVRYDMREVAHALPDLPYSSGKQRLSVEDRDDLLGGGIVPSSLFSCAQNQNFTHDCVSCPLDD